MLLDCSSASDWPAIEWPANPIVFHDSISHARENLSLPLQPPTLKLWMQDKSTQSPSYRATSLAGGVWPDLCGPDERVRVLDNDLVGEAMVGAAHKATDGSLKVRHIPLEALRRQRLARATYISASATLDCILVCTERNEAAGPRLDIKVGSNAMLSRRQEHHGRMVGKERHALKDVGPTHAH